MLGTLTAQSLEDCCAEPGLHRPARVLVSICASLLRTALHADWQYDVRPSGDMCVPPATSYDDSTSRAPPSLPINCSFLR